MKLKLTEKFLWDLYKLIDKKDKLMDALKSRKWRGRFKDPFEIIWPDIYGIKEAYWEEYKDEKKRKNFARFVRYLKDRGYLNVKDLKNRKAIMITPKGMKKILRLEIESGKMKKRSDKKWQMVLFDIPETRKKDREHFRWQLKYLGYQQLQKSIWVCPYDVLEYTQQLIKNYKLDRFVRLLLVEEMII